MKDARHETMLWAAQRVTAAILAFCVLVHLVTIIYAVRGGLSASAILARTHGSFPWAAFYTTFVIATAVHASIGLRAILAEWLSFKGRAAGVAVVVIGLALAGLGVRAVIAVTA